MKLVHRIALVAGSTFVWCASAAAMSLAPTPPTVHTFHFRLNGNEVVPAVNTPGTGWVTVTLDDVTGDVSVTGEFQCLSDNVRAVHIHGPAPAGQNAGVIVTLGMSGSTSGTISGGGTLTAQQVQDMLNGQAYIQLHTFVNFSGELRGQVVACASPGVTSSNGSGANPVILSSAVGPLIGGSWSADLDCAGNAPGLAALWFHNRPSAGTMIRAGEVLLNLSSKRLVKTVLPHASNVVSFGYAMPNDTSLCGLVVYAQGVVTGSPGIRLSNRLNLVCGL